MMERRSVRDTRRPTKGGGEDGGGDDDEEEEEPEEAKVEAPVQVGPEEELCVAVVVVVLAAVGAVIAKTVQTRKPVPSTSQSSAVKYGKVAMPLPGLCTSVP